MAILIVTKIFNGDQVIIVASKVAFNSIYLYSVDYIYLYYIIPTKHNIATIILFPLNNYRKILHFVTKLNTYIDNVDVRRHYIYFLRIKETISDILKK